MNNLTPFCVLRLPFDWKNPFGYLVAISMESVGVYYILYSTSCVMGLSVGLSYILISFVKDIKEDLLQFEGDASMKEKEKAKLLPKKLIEFLENYTEARA